MLCKPYKLKDQAVRVYLFTVSCPLRFERVDRLNLVVISGLDK